MSDVCRFCGYKGSHLQPLNENICKFYKILPVDITRDDANMPQTLCQLCELKIFEILEFFDRVAEVDRDLRKNMTTARKPNTPKLSISLEMEVPGISGLHSQTEPLVGNIADKIKDELNTDDSDNADDCASEHFDGEVPMYSPKPESAESPILLAEKVKSSEVPNEHDMAITEDPNSNNVCCSCRESFPSALLLFTHVCVTTELICKYCGIKCDTRRSRTLHETIHENQRPPMNHECSKCGKKFESPVMLAIHRAKHHSLHERKKIPQHHKCSKCERNFSSQAFLAVHGRTCKGEVRSDRLSIIFKCTECGKKFHSSSQYLKHNDNHAISESKDLRCEICGLTFQSKALYYDHIPSHPELAKFDCNLCEKKFFSARLLQAHRDDHRHSGIKSPHVCKDAECCKKFNSSAQHLKYTGNHAISEKNRKDVRCEICGLTFQSKAIYYDHIPSHPELAKFDCNLCEKKFFSARLLLAHRYDHSGIKSPHECNDCGKTFVKKASLTNHRRSQHTGETPYTCTICTMNFPTNYQLRSHQYKHIFKN